MRCAVTEHPLILAQKRGKCDPTAESCKLQCNAHLAGGGVAAPRVRVGGEPLFTLPPLPLHRLPVRRLGIGQEERELF